MNGFASQGGPPPVDEQITYPFPSPIDPTQTVHQQESGQKTFDYNDRTGTAHYGLYADWVEAVRVAAGADGPEIIDDMRNARRGLPADVGARRRRPRPVAQAAGPARRRGSNAGAPRRSAERSGKVVREEARQGEAEARLEEEAEEEEAAEGSAARLLAGCASRRPPRALR